VVRQPRSTEKQAVWILDTARMEGGSSETRDSNDLQASESHAHEMYIVYIYLLLMPVYFFQEFTL